MPKEGRHIPVLLNETIDGLNFREGDILLDATYGGGGHSEEVRRRFGKGIKIIGLDLDPKTSAIHANFRDLDKVLDDLGIQKVSKIIFDLGWRSDQLESGRGFSFQKDEPLLMTFGQPTEKTLTAKEIVNNWQEKNIADILYGFGGERYSRRIAKGIVNTRGEESIMSSGQLVEIIRRAVPAPYRKGRIHFATRTFQALRMAVNNELSSLEQGLSKGVDKLAPDGRIAVIAYHSLEDRIVKKFFTKLASEKVVKLINKKPIRPTSEEIKQNPRARSAKLRIIEKVNES